MKVKHLTIENFKSIKHISIDAARVNVFIGEPNTGKSNILESIGLLSGLYYDPLQLNGFVRYSKLIDLFHNQDGTKPFKIVVNSDGQVVGSVADGLYGIDIVLGDHSTRLRFFTDGRIDNSSQIRTQNWAQFSSFKYYLFKLLTEFRNPRLDCLAPPNGNNLCSLAASNPGIREIMVRQFQEFGFV